MSGSAPQPRPLLDSRACGECNVCCVSLTIDDDELQKAQGFRCGNARRDNSCAIYPTRPRTCREFFCGWRSLRWVRESLRPDRSGVLIRFHIQVGANGERTEGVVVSLLHAKALQADGLAETVAAAVAAGVPVFLQIPGPPGYTSGQARINEALHGAVLAKDKPALLAILREARNRGLKGPKKRIVLRKPATHPVQG